MLASAHARVSSSRCPQETQTTHHAVLPDERCASRALCQTSPKMLSEASFTQPLLVLWLTLCSTMDRPSVFETGHAGAEHEYFAHKIAKTNADRMQQLQIICVYMCS